MHYYPYILLFIWSVGTILVGVKERNKELVFLQLIKLSFFGGIIGTILGALIGVIIASSVFYHEHPNVEPIILTVAIFSLFGCFLGIFISTSMDKESWIKA